MKTAIIITEQIRQIVLTPENEHEKTVLKMLTVDDTIEVASYEGNFSDSREPYEINVTTCRGGHLREYKTSDHSRILVIKPKKVEPFTA